jgi:hypothetical protein
MVHSRLACVVIGAVTLAVTGLSISCDTAKIEGVGSSGGRAGGAGGSGPGGGSGGGATGSGANGGSGVVPPLNLDAAAGSGGGGSSGVKPDAAGGEAASCATETHQAKQTPLDVLLLVDTSGSMREGAGAETKWTLTRNALTAFWREPKSAGLGLGLQFFPFKGADRPCASDDACGVAVAAGTCGDTGVCAGGGAFTAMQSCDPDGITNGCPGGAACSITGRCATSGAGCAPIGMPCAGGGGMCMNRGSV